MGVEKYGTFSEVRERLDEILIEVRKKELSLEKSLDLYEEAVQLGNRCAELVDKSDFSAEEAEAAMKLIEKGQADGEVAGEGGEGVDKGAGENGENAASEDAADENATGENAAASDTEEEAAESETENAAATEAENTSDAEQENTIEAQ